ncbi:MAG: type I-B CRISPR-associated protein Cas7/Cst2/DevR [Oscillospiraceae bacterium]|nr:type I-B CRISPR-associated protein Cas7/Cst2/DevR [Oscillospiraceae bacterium]
MKKALTITMIFRAQGLNYGEGIGNISELKKLTRGSGKQYSYASRQCLRYDISRLGEEWFNWNLHVVDKSKGTVQFGDKFTIKDSVEMDLFGYMKTIKGKDNETGGSNIRSAKVRLSPAISLEEYKSDMDFLTNKGMADRIGEMPNLANTEQHLSFYTYTVTFDLDKIGIDENVILDNPERAKRVKEVLTIIKLFNRDIRGRRENLSPLFAIGGLYEVATPFFLGRVELLCRKDNYIIKSAPLDEALALTFNDRKVGEDTKYYVDEGILYLGELKEISNESRLSLNEFFKHIEKEVDNFYGV